MLINYKKEVVTTSFFVYITHEMSYNGYIQVSNMVIEDRWEYEDSIWTGSIDGSNTDCI